jgi:hypothetical protein
MVWPWMMLSVPSTVQRFLFCTELVLAEGDDLVGRHGHAARSRCSPTARRRRPSPGMEAEEPAAAGVYEITPFSGLGWRRAARAT